MAYGVPLCAATALVALVLAEPGDEWAAAVLFVTGVFLIFTAASLQEGTGRVAAGTTRWRGVEQPALLVAYSPWKTAWMSLVVGASIGLLGFVVLMNLLPNAAESWPFALGAALTAAFIVGASVSFVALAIGPNEIAMLPEGFLYRRGLLSYFIPWSAVADVTKLDGYGFGDDIGFDKLRLIVHDRRMIQSNWLGRLWRTLRMDPGLTIQLWGLRVPDDELVSTAFRYWKDPGATRRRVTTRFGPRSLSEIHQRQRRSGRPRGGE